MFDKMLYHSILMKKAQKKCEKALPIVKEINAILKISN